MKVAVIGAGPAGLSTLKALLDENIPNLEVVCYEHAHQPGGEWNFNDKIGTDEHGLPIHGSMYKGMRTNLPTDLMIIHPDYPWPENSKVFPFRERVLQYLCGFADRYDLNRYIKFEHYVKEISKVDESSSQVKIEVYNLNDATTSTNVFDYIVLCSGKHGKAYIPHDISNFTGQVLHYHDLRDHNRLSDKRVIVVGAAFGAMDMTIHLMEVAESVVVSYHRQYPFFGPQAGVIFKPEIVKFDGKTVYFIDGSIYNADAILYATGFQTIQPLAEDLELKWSIEGLLFPLYKHVVHPTFPSVLFVGRGTAAVVLASRFQATYAAQVISQKIKLPSSNTMLKAIDDYGAPWHEIADRPNDYKSIIPKIEVEFDVIDELTKSTGCVPALRYSKGLYYSLFNIMREDLFNYQEYMLKVETNTAGNFEFRWTPPVIRRIPKTLGDEASSA